MNINNVFKQNRVLLVIVFIIIMIVLKIILNASCDSAKCRMDINNLF